MSSSESDINSKILWLTPFSNDGMESFAIPTGGDCPPEGDDYTIRIASVGLEHDVDFSDHNFSMIQLIPSLVAVEPLDGAVNISPATGHIEFTFDIEMDGVYSIIVMGLEDTGPLNVSWSADSKTFFCAWSGDLPTNAEIEWILNPSTSEHIFASAAGKPFAMDISGSFTTGD